VVAAAALAGAPGMAVRLTGRSVRRGRSRPESALLPGRHGNCHQERQGKEQVVSRQAEQSKNSIIAEAIRVIKKQFGGGAIMRLDGSEVVPVSAISTGSLGVDLALGIGGLPRGRIVEIYGPEASGKTTLTLHAIAEAQQSGGICAFIDAEHALDVAYARRLGVRPGDLLVSQPDCGEQALEITDTLVRTAAIDLIVVDSVAALTPRAELEGEMGDAHVGLQARLMSQALRKLTAAVARTRTVVIFINQLRQKIGVAFGNPETTTGGNALKFYCSVRLDIRRRGTIKQEDVVVGAQVRVKVVKNKLAAPFREAQVEVLYGTGIDRLGELLALGEQVGLVERSGAWYAYQGERLGQGRERALAYLAEHGDRARVLRQQIVEAWRRDQAEWAQPPGGAVPPQEPSGVAPAVASGVASGAPAESGAAASKAAGLP
jgi:recombination protein RecA